MAKVQAIEIDAAAAMRGAPVTVDIVVRGLWLARLRIWIAARLVSLVALVAGLDFRLARQPAEIFGALGAEQGTVPEGYPLSAAVGDPGLDLTIFANIEFLVNGDPIEEVVRYDVQGGCIEHFATDQNGMIQIIGDQVVYQRRYGRIDLLFKKPASKA